MFIARIVTKLQVPSNQPRTVPLLSHSHLKGGKSQCVNASLTPNLPVDSEYVVAWNQCSVVALLCFTDLGEIHKFLLLTLVSVYSLSSVVRYVHQPRLSVHMAILTTAHAQLPRGRLF